MSALVAALAVVPTVHAATPGWYLGAGVGSADLRGGAEAIDPNIGAEGAVLGLDHKDTGWKVFGGYQFNRNWAAEAIYAKFGTFSVVHVDGLATATDRAKPEVFCLAGVGTLPLGANWSLLGKAGVCHWNDHPSQSESIVLDGETSSGNDPMFGVGAAYDLTRRVQLRAEWERYQNVVHNRGDMNYLSVSMSYRF